MRSLLLLAVALFNSAIRNSQSEILPRGRGARVVELAALEMLWTGNRSVGSNPTLSAMTLGIWNLKFEISDLSKNAESFTKQT